MGESYVYFVALCDFYGPMAVLDVGIWAGKIRAFDNSSEALDRVVAN